MAGYLGNIPVPQATQTREVFTATASQTSFATAGYPVGFVDVWLNGVKLINGTDFTATNGSDVVLAVGAAAGDTVEVISNSTFEVNSQNFTGGLTINNDGATVLTVDRATSDGSIVDFKKSGTTVGSIGNNGGDVYIGTGVSGLLFLDGDPSITPHNTSTNTANDNAIDIGRSSRRFKDLYLSGGVYLGGTGAANKLDDYETGTWTPTIVASGTNPTVSYSARSGTYVKVGNSVTIHVYMLLSSFSGGSGAVQLGSLPFTPSATRCSGSLSYSSGFPTAPQACLNSSSSPSATLYYFSGSTVIGVPTTDLNGNEQFRLSLTYEV